METIEQNGIRPLNDMQLRVMQRDNIQRLRIQHSNRIEAVKRGDAWADGQTMNLLEQYHGQFQDMEKQLDRDIAGAIKDLPDDHILRYMLKIKGVGPSLAAQFWAKVDIQRAADVSSLWKYAGFGVTDGKRDRPVKGQKLPYNRKLKVVVFKIGDSMLRTRGTRTDKDPLLYADLYYEKREEYDAREWGENKLHRHLAAKGYMQKIWMQHLWISWRTLEGLPVNMPWVLRQNNAHTHYIAPEAYGWPAVANEVK